MPPDPCTGIAGQLIRRGIAGRVIPTSRRLGTASPVPYRRVPRCRRRVEPSAVVSVPPVVSRAAGVQRSTGVGGRRESAVCRLISGAGCVRRFRRGSSAGVGLLTLGACVWGTAPAASSPVARPARGYRGTTTAYIPTADSHQAAYHSSLVRSTPLRQYLGTVGGLRRLDAGDMCRRGRFPTMGASGRHLDRSTNHRFCPAVAAGIGAEGVEGLVGLRMPGATRRVCAHRDPPPSTERSRGRVLAAPIVAKVQEPSGRPPVGPVAVGGGGRL